jgi:hypothetical protein
VTVAAAFAPTFVAALSAVVATAPLGVRTVAVTIAEAALAESFCSSVATDTVADPIDTDGVATNTPL